MIFQHSVLWIIGVFGLGALILLLWNRRRMIAALRRSEEQRRESEAHLAAILDASPESAFLIDGEGVIIAANRVFGQRLGCDCAALRGRCVYDFFPPEVSQQRAAQVAEALRAGQPAHFEDRRGEYWLSNSLQPVRDGTGAVRWVAVFSVDIAGRKQTEEVLRRSEEQYRRIVETAAEGVWALDAQLRTTFVNRRLADLFGYAPEEMLGQPVENFVFAEELDDHRAKAAQRRRGQSDVYERRFRRRDGGVLWAIVSAAPLRDENGQFTGSFAMVTDVTERKRIETALQASHEYIHAVLDSVNDAVFVNDARTGQIIDVNRRMCEIYGYRREEALQLSIGQLSLDQEPYSESVALDKLRWVQSEGAQTFEWIARKKSGHLFWVEVNIRFAVMGGEERFISTVHDITERKQMEEELRRLSTLDSLTGLLTRRQFFTLAQQEYERFRRYHRPLALIMADIDYFKPINDQHGHLIGDQVLQTVAETLQRNLRQVDILGRYGGEEFVMVLPETDTATAQALAERLRAAIAQAVVSTAQGAVSVTLSLGVAAISDGHPMTLEQLLDSADQMLYQAKQAGRNCVRVWDVTANPLN